MLCAECVMRRRYAILSATGKEPVLTGPAVTFDTVNPLAEAVTIVQGTALCEKHIVECLKIEHVSTLAAPNGGQIVRPLGAHR